MKKVFLLSMLLVFITGFTHAKHRFEFLEGKYGNYYHDIQIKVKSIDGGVKVKGIPGKKGWRKFFISRRNVLTERHGNNRLIINGRNTISIHNRRRGRGMRFLKIKGQNYRRTDRHWKTYDEYYNDEKYYDDSRIRRGDTRDSGRGYDDGYGYNYGNNYPNIVGEWYSNDLRKLVIIEKDGNGIKARLSGSKKWSKFKRGDNGNYIDNKGNIYYLESNDRLVWQDRSGRNKYVLSKS